MGYNTDSTERLTIEPTLAQQRREQLLRFAQTRHDGPYSPAHEVGPAATW